MYDSKVKTELSINSSVTTLDNFSLLSLTSAHLRIPYEGIPIEDIIEKYPTTELAKAIFPLAVLRSTLEMYGKVIKGKIIPDSFRMIFIKKLYLIDFTLKLLSI